MKERIQHEINHLYAIGALSKCYEVYEKFGVYYVRNGNAGIGVNLEDAQAGRLDYLEVVAQ